MYEVRDENFICTMNIEHAAVKEGRNDLDGTGIRLLKGER